jgi:hypothetical protein
MSAYLASRPPRRMPSVWVVAGYWSPLGIFAEIDLWEPGCFACGMDPSPDDRYSAADGPRERWLGVGGYLHRAHLVDRRHDGLDGPQNLVLLCDGCHKWMPSFRDGREAIRWVRAGSVLLQLARRIAAREAGWQVVPPVPWRRLPQTQPVLF